MDIRILGPLEVGDPPLPIGGGKPRALLALLVLSAGRTVSRDRIIDELWGERVPDTATKMVQIHVSQLRKVLPPGLLVTRASGYAVDVADEDVDLHRAERMLRDARAARERDDPKTAARLLGDALGLWRGAALAEFDEPFAGTEAPRIEQLRLTLLEERIDADLALGRHADVVGELEALVGRHPLRERARGQLMVALYRCGRQADALAAYADARRTLDEELGLEPSTALRELERGVLRQDPALDPPSPPIPVPTPPSTPAADPGPPAPERPTVRYARSGDLSIAYEVTGAGPPDLVLIPGFVSHLAMDREEPRHVRFLDRLASFSRLIRFDKRGTGLSDRPSGLPDLETRMDDVRAVMDAAGSRRAVLLGYSEGGPLAILAAAAHPERVAALVLIGSYAKRIDPDDDYPWAMPRERRRRHIDQLERDWGFEAMMSGMCPRADEAMARWWGERCRAAASPGAARALTEMNSLIDVRHVLPAVRVPTLVLHRSGDMRVVVGNGRYLGERIPGARYVELPGADHFPAVDGDQLLDVVEPWVRALPDPPAVGDADPVLATILAVEGIADRDVLRREVGRHRGRPGGSADVALFDGPSRALRCGLALAGDLRGRVGVSTGEVTGAEGPAVEIAVALARLAEPGQVLAGSTTRDLVAGSDLAFADLGERRLPGDPAPRRVFAAASGGAATTSPPPASPSSPTTPARPPFVGRDHEMMGLTDALALAVGGHGRLVAVCGDPGIGKTRLARELAERAAATGARVAWGRAHEHQGAPPFLPWSEALGELVRAEGADALAAELGTAAAELAAVVPALAPAARGEGRAEGDPEQARFRLLDAAALLVGAAANRTPVVLVLEDLHAADPGSLAMLEFVVRSLREGVRVLVVATYRDAEMPRGHPLDRALATLGADDRVERVRLAGLGRAEVARVIAATSGTAPAEDLVEAAWTHTEGNPLFLTELVRLLQGEGALSDEARAWDLTIPEGVRAVIRRRLDRLSAPALHALDAAAVLGREFGLRELAAVTDADPDEVLGAVEEALEARLVEEVPGLPDRFAFSHGLIRETLLSERSAARRARMAAHVLTTLEALHGERVPAAAALHHAGEAEPVLGEGPVVRYATLAGEEALAAHAHEEAAAHFRRALAALGDADDDRAARARFGLGRALLAARELHELGEAVSALRLAFEHHAAAGDTTSALRVATHPLPPHLHLESTGVTRLVERALELADPDGPDAARLLSTLGWLTGINRADLPAARAAFDRAVEIASMLGDPALEVRALAQRQYVEMFHLEWDACLASGRRAIALAGSAGDRRGEMAAHGWVARALARSGDLPGARRHAAAATPHAAALHERYWLATSALHNGMLAALEGDWAEARRWTDTALEARPRDPRSLGLRALVEHTTGELTTGEAFLARMGEPLPGSPVPGPGAEHPFAAAHIPLCERIGGPSPQGPAARAAGEAVLALPTAPPYLRSLAHLGLGLLAAADGDATAAARHHEALAPYAGAASVIPPASMDRMLCVMALAAGWPDRAVAHGRAALTFCERAGYRPEAAWSACELAAALEARAAPGDGDEAAVLRARAHAIACATGMRPLAGALAPIA